MARLLEIRGQPRNVEVPAVGESEILEAQQPNLARSEECAPRDAAMRRCQMLGFLDQPHFGRVNTFVFAGIVAVPPKEHKGPHYSDAAEQPKCLPPGHQLEHLMDDQRRERASPARAHPQDALRANSLTRG